MESDGPNGVERQMLPLFAMYITCNPSVFDLRVDLASRMANQHTSIALAH